MADTHIIGCLLGTALGDSIGLPYEGLSRRRAARMLGPPDRHRFFFGRGMVSDDTEHTCMVAWSLIEVGTDVDKFREALARKMRRWLLFCPAGVGFATLRAIVKLWLGWTPDRSGVFSAGNGPAMRAAIVGAVMNDRDRMVQLIRTSTRITHTDPKAEYGAIAVALAAQMARTNDPITGEDFVRELRSLLPDEANELLELVNAAVVSVEHCEPTTQFASSLGCEQRVTGYVYHTVPVAIHAWLSNPDDLRRAVMAAIDCGGDADTTAAIVGGIVGAGVGEDRMPTDWMSRMCDPAYPFAILHAQGLMLALTPEEKSRLKIPPKAIASPIAIVVPRNLVFLAVVLFHGFRRLLPPY